MSVESTAHFWDNVEKERIANLTAEDKLQMEITVLEWQVKTLMDYAMMKTGLSREEVVREMSEHARTKKAS